MIAAGDQFTWDGKALEYLDAEYNSTLLNERAIEVPIARRWLEGRDPNAGVEVGNVLRHYGPAAHRVIDRYEHGPGVENMDVFDLTTPVAWVLAISTLEHVGQDYGERPDPAAGLAACRHLRALLQPGGAMLATIPIGQNPCMDAAIMYGWLLADRETTAVYHEEGWSFTGDRVWRPLRECTWPSAVWIGEWYT